MTWMVKAYCKYAKRWYAYKFTWEERARELYAEEAKAKLYIIIEDTNQKILVAEKSW